jgi:hypothetical protein
MSLMVAPLAADSYTASGDGPIKAPLAAEFWQGQRLVTSCWVTSVTASSRIACPGCLKGMIASKNVQMFKRRQILCHSFYLR